MKRAMAPQIEPTGGGKRSFLSGKLKRLLGSFGKLSRAVRGKTINHMGTPGKEKETKRRNGAVLKRSHSLERGRKGMRKGRGAERRSR